MPFLTVHCACLQPLLGQHHEDDVSFAALCSEAGQTESKRWFNLAAVGTVAGQWRETHVLDFLRRCTDLGDSQILNVFDLLDSEGRGTIGFAEFYYLALMLMAMKEGKMKVFLYLRSAQTILLLQALARNSLDACADVRMTPKIACAHVCMLLRPFGLEELMPARLTQLRFTPQHMSAPN
mmetsp:Transcript_11069/g.17537  ORF Transcript_11069/g.17537 Transcript_11069/m.17537 type:complete len:180 (-) Transcript_11069:148-687(-)